MKKFLLNVLAIVSVFLICGNLTAWGEETKIIDFTLVKNDESTPPSVVNLENGTITFTTTTFEAKTNNGITCYGTKLVSDSKYVEVKLNDPFKVGDVIKIKEFSASTPSDSKPFGIKLVINNVINNEDNETLITTLPRSATAGKDYETVEYKVVAGDNLVGNTTFRIKKATDNNIYFSGITITRTTSTTPTPASISVVSKNPYSVLVNNKATLEVYASGYPEPTLQWYKCDDTEKTNAKPIEGATDSKYEFTPTTTGIQYYYCEAKNTTDTENTDVSDVITVNVQNYIPSNDANITGIKVNNAINAIANGSDYTAVLLNYANAAVDAVVTLTDSKATIEGGTTLSVTIGEKKNFTVKAEDGTTKDYSITVTNTNDVNVAENKFAISSEGLYTNGQKFIAPDIVASLSETCVTAGTSFAVDGSKPNYVNTDFANTILGANNPSISSNVPTGGHFVKFVPSKDGKLDVAVFLNKGKELYVVENSTRLESNTGFTAAFKVNNAGEIVDQEFKSNTVATAAAGIISLNVTTGNTYYVFCSGSKIGFQGFVFTPAVDPYTLTTEDTDYYSLYLDYNATVPENVTAYTGSLSADEKTLVLSQITDGVIPANQGVLVKSTVAGSYTFNQSATGSDATSDLKGVTTATEVSALEVEGKTVLTLGIKNKVVGFRKPASGNVGANKAYLLVDTPTGSAAPELVIGIDDDETTGINGVKADNADVDAPMFNIAGQRVSNNAKGLVIKNGKKYMLK